jgi:transaldolase|tara:strand:- start:161 stop:802 length:642 start_codon:yes stop_codon:yes gene_type:complete
MRIFLDTAIVDDIKKRNDGLITGVTTNPTLIAKSGRVPEEVYEEIFDQGIKDLSIEVRGEYFDELIANALMTNQEFGNKATIKLPCTVDGLTACKYLESRHIRVNMTLVFSVSQAILCSIAGATYVSPFVGRLNDNGQDGVQLIADIAKVFCHNRSETQILAASLRDARSAAQCFAAGAHICTLPPKVYDDMFKHVLTDKGLEQFRLDFDRNV